MEVTLVGVTNGLENLDEIKKFSQTCGRICYSGKDF